MREQRTVQFTRREVGAALAVEQRERVLYMKEEIDRGLASEKGVYWKQRSLAGGLEVTTVTSTASGDFSAGIMQQCDVDQVLRQLVEGAFGAGTEILSGELVHSGEVGYNATVLLPEAGPVEFDYKQPAGDGSGGA